MEMPSANFSFLGVHDPLLVKLGGEAEHYFFTDPNICLIRLRQFGEVLAQRVAAEVGIYTGVEEDQLTRLNALRDRGVLTPEVANLFHGLRKAGNDAVHAHKGTREDAIHQIKMARTLGAWFYKSFKDPSFKAGSFTPLSDPRLHEISVTAELKRLQDELSASQQEIEAARLSAENEARRRAEAEQIAEQSAEERAVWQSLAEEMEAQLDAERQRLASELAALQAQTITTPASEVLQRIESAQLAGNELDLDEADTRRLIDEQLREAGWEAYTGELTYAKGTRPQRGRNLAIAEWPTSNGPADYVLFVGLKAVAVVEAKRKRKDVAGSIEQSKRYSRGYLVRAEEELAGGPWGEYRIPFLFATNGRPFLRQLETKSGIWFLDARRPQNHARALEGWYRPDGLEGLLEQDIDRAENELRSSATDYLPLHEYQQDAVRAVESALAEGRRQVLLAMATGTGKTRTCIGLSYRLIKSRRFRRVLFLVDRAALGEQATNAFKDVRLENLQSFADIYDVKELADMVPETDTKLHVATIQGMMKRLLYPTNEGDAPPVDRYDCIVVDECHRGYNLDRELSETELSFRNERDYISKYRRVLDHFDAVKIGLTATPALHTTEIFGEPVYQYSYRQAVIDGYLIDHEPPVRIVTKLAEDGMTWHAGEDMKIYDARRGQIDLIHLPDEVDVDIDAYNKRVITENFNKAVCGELARHIDPSLEGKTLIYCATDYHADMVVKLLKDALDEQYGGIEDDAVAKITGASDRPMELIRRFKNERNPNIAVTVDLLTTGIDVPEITNLVFIRRVRSRILYEQMLGRATRLCPAIEKERFRIFDAVDLYSALEPYSSMKPVVSNPSITFIQLIKELTEIKDEPARREVRDQLVAKLQRKKRHLKKARREDFETITGSPFDETMKKLRKSSPEELADWFAARPELGGFLDEVTGEGEKLIISEHEDEVRHVERGYGTAKRPEDFLESFRAYIRDNINRLPALLVVTQRPRDLTRQQLKDLKLELDRAGFGEMALRTAWREMTNEEIAASVIGFIRNQALGSPLMPYEERVGRALKKILASRAWTMPQRRWLERIGKQLKVETVVDREALEHGQFEAEGGYARLDKVFDGQLEQVLGDFNDALWSDVA
jgi:type I restriction enzyme, R subunit